MNYLSILFIAMLACIALCNSKTKNVQELKQFISKKVVDAETIVGTFEGENEEVTIKLYGISPPKEEKDYKKVQKFIERRALGQVLGVKVISIDEAGVIKGVLYGRTDTLNTSLLKLGLATWNSKEAPNQTDFKDIEQRAKKGRLGIWKPKRDVSNEL